MDIQYNFYSVCIMTGFISFLGFCLENAWLALTKGYIDNRGMRAPFLFGYGGLVMAMYFLLGTPEDMTLLGEYEIKLSPEKERFCYFLTAALTVSAGEIILGYTVKKTCGMDYWNYSWIPLHVTPYTSVPTSIGFGLVITHFMGSVFTPLMTLMENIPQGAAKIGSLILLAVMLPDFAGAFKVMYKTGKPRLLWQINLRRSARIPMLETKN